MTRVGAARAAAPRGGGAVLRRQADARHARMSASLDVEHANGGVAGVQRRVLELSGGGGAKQM